MLRDQILIQNYITVTQPYYLYTVFKFLNQNYAARHFLASKDSSNEKQSQRQSYAGPHTGKMGKSALSILARLKRQKWEADQIEHVYSGQLCTSESLLFPSCGGISVLFYFKHKSETIFLSLEKGADAVLVILSLQPSGHTSLCPTANVDFYWAVESGCGKGTQLSAFLKWNNCGPHTHTFVLEGMTHKCILQVPWTSPVLTFESASTWAPCTQHLSFPSCILGQVWEQLSSSTDP